MRAIFRPIIVLLLGTAAILPQPATAQAPVVLTVDAGVHGASIPDDFIGLSFEASNLRPDSRGRRLFSAENAPLISLFKGLGIKNLRVGGGTVDLSRYPVPGRADIDALFAFARAAGVKVIYSFRLLNGDKTNAAALAGYIWQNYRPLLEAFAIGNEPDWRVYHDKDPKIKDYPSYLADWRDFAAAVAAAAPGAGLAGPDTGSNYPERGGESTDYRGESWTQRFADDEKDSGIVRMILQHDYVGQSARKVTAPAAIDALLSPGWATVNYPVLYQKVIAGVVADGLPYRMTECNDYTGGVKGASNAFASALWALDYMHWWAAHGCAGVNFHNKEWILTDTIYRDADGHYRINPKAYGLKTFDLGSHGQTVAATLSGPGSAGMDAGVAGYAVADATGLYVTIINWAHGPAAAAATVTIKLEHFSATAAGQIALEAVPAGAGSAPRATLGGAAITDAGSWSGQWTPLKIESGADGNGCTVTVGPASAMLVHFH